LFVLLFCFCETIPTTNSVVDIFETVWSNNFQHLRQNLKSNLERSHVINSFDEIGYKIK
jgi:hypothetical protein